MIQLFNIPKHIIDTSNFTNLLHDKIVHEFTDRFCKHVGGKYGCAVNSATSAIFLLSYYNKFHFKIPTMLPPVVINAIINGNSTYEFTDDINWIGNSYVLYNDENIRIIDSAQEVKYRKFEANDVVIYSFYPTKPIGSCDGGMIVSNNLDLILKLKTIVNNGNVVCGDSWKQCPENAGWKMYMNSIQAYIANNNLSSWTNKWLTMKQIKYQYQNEIYYHNTSYHLYRIRVVDNKKFIEYMDKCGIKCGIHYKCLHKNSLYNYNTMCPQTLSKSEQEELHTVSIPFHENLSYKDVKKVITCCLKSGMLIK